jgi:hypothetical protein
MAEAETKERVEWELPARLMEDLRDYCRAYSTSEEEAARKAIERLLAERLLEEGE